MADLISIDRAKAQIPNAQDCDDQVIAAIVSAASNVIETYCNRTFAQATFDELYHGTGTPYLFVNNPPLNRVVAVRTGLLPAVFLQFNDPNNQTQVATVEVTATGVVLTKLYNGTTTTNTFSYQAYPTFTTLAAAVNALGNGWVATLSNQFAYWQTSELVVSPGTYGARNISLPLQVFWWTLPYYRANYDLGEIENPNGYTPGYHNYRVTYVGGFADIPSEVQQACAELVQLTYASITANPLMQSETLDKYSYTRTAETGFMQLSATSRKALNQYVIHRVARYK